METIDEILSQLTAPIKSFRLFALEWAIREGNSQRLLEALRERKNEEDDSECLMLLYHALVTVARRIEGGQYAVPSIEDLSEFQASFEKAGEQEKLELIEQIPANILSRLGPSGPALVKGESNPVIIACVINKFSKVWPIDNLEFLTRYLSSDSLSLRFAALEALIHNAPSVLIEYLPQLLTSFEPRTRALAVRGLAKLDLDEALAHLEVLLLSPEESDRFAALKNCFFFPFEPIKPCLYKYFAAETNLPLLNQFGMLFESNPDPEVPYNLWEIAERAPAQKAKVIKKVIQSACKTLQDSGILQEGFPNYRDQLQKWIYQRAATRYVQDLIDRMYFLKNSGETEKPWRAQSARPQGMSHANSLRVAKGGACPPLLRSYDRISGSEQDLAIEMEQAVERCHKRPIMREAFEAALEWQIDDSIKEKIRGILGAPIDTQSIWKTTPIEKISDLSLEDAKRMVSSWDPEDFPKVKTALEGLVLGTETAAELRAVSLRTAIRLDFESFCDQTEKWLKHSEIQLSLAALQYLGHFDPERVFPHIGHFLGHRNKRVKGLALKILKRFDSVQAISFINAMLLGMERSGGPEMAISCMIHFDFPLVREKLTSFLIAHPEAQVLESALCLFQANPDPENIYCLFQIEKSYFGAKADLVRSVRAQSLTLLLEIGLLKPDSPVCEEKHLEDKWKKEQEKKELPRPAYAVKAAPPRTVPPLFDRSSDSGSLGEVRKVMTWIFLTVILAGGFGYLIFSSFMGPPDSEVPQILYSPNPAIPFSGTVKERDKETGGIFIRDENGNKLVLFPKSDGFFEPKVGDKIQGTVVPFQRDPRGIIRGRIQSMEKR